MMQFKNIPLCIGAALILTMSLLLRPAVPDVLPEGVAVEKAFRPGYGHAVGTVQLVQGPVWILHDKINAAFHAKDGLPLYKGDTLFTEAKGRIRIELNDGSVMTLASNTRLTLTRSIYDPQKKIRTSFLKMAIGKARFFVKKLFKFKRAEFKVKTSTFVAGVRGSDFIITATPERTEVTTFKNTILEVVSLAAPEAEPAVLNDFQHTIVELGQLPQRPETLSPEKIETIKGSISMPEGPRRPVNNKAPQPAGPQSKKSQPENEAEDRIAFEQPSNMAVVINQAELPLPEIPEQLPLIEADIVAEQIERVLSHDDDQQQTEDIINDQKEKPPPLPAFPEAPQQP